MVFRWEISQVFQTWVPKNLKLSPRHHITSPKISHFHRPGSLVFDGAVDDTNSRRVVHVDGRGKLWVAKFLERQAQDARLFQVHK